VNDDVGFACKTLQHIIINFRALVIAIRKLKELGMDDIDDQD